MEKGLAEYEALEQQMHAARTDAKDNSLIIQTYASRIIYEMDEENRAYYFKKREQKERAQAAFLQRTTMVS